MLVAKIKHTGLGNSVANYTESIFRCDNCNGEGWIVLDKEDLIERMEGLPYNKAIAMYRGWKLNDHKCDCPECQGLGEWTDRT